MGMFKEMGDALGMPRWLRTTTKLVIGLLILLMIVVGMVSEYIKPWERGLKQIKFGEGKGFEEATYEGSFRYIIIPLKEKMHHIGCQLRHTEIIAVLEYDDKGNVTIKEGAGLEVPTTDGSKVISDVGIIWRVFKETVYDKDGKLVHGGPSQLRERAGLKESNWERLIRETTEDACKRALGSLKTDDYYNAPLRESKAVLALDMLNNGWMDEEGKWKDGWNKHGVEVMAILIRSYYYTPVIDNAIALKNIQIQEEALQEAMEEKATNTAEVRKVEAAGDASIAVKRNWGQQQVNVILAEADLYEKTMIAKGDLEVKKAVAMVNEMKAKALEESGSEVYVAHELSDLPSLLRGGVVTQINPFDTGEWIDLLVGKKAVEKSGGGNND